MFVAILLVILMNGAIHFPIQNTNIRSNPELFPDCLLTATIAINTICIPTCFTHNITNYRNYTQYDSLNTSAVIVKKNFANFI